MEGAAQPPPCETEFASQLGHLFAQYQEWNAAGGGSLPDLMAGWSAPHYLLNIRQQLANLAIAGDRIKLLNQVIGNAVALQRGGHWTPQRQLNRERLALDQEKHRHALALSQPPARKHRDLTQPLTDHERQAILDKMDELFGLK